MEAEKPPETPLFSLVPIALQNELKEEVKQILAYEAKQKKPRYKKVKK